MEGQKPKHVDPVQALKHEISQSIISLTKETDNVLSNLSKVASGQVSEGMTEEKCVAAIETMSQHLIKAQVGVLSSVFKELNIAKTIDLLLGRLCKDLLKLPEDIVAQLQTRHPATSEETQDSQVALRTSLKAILSALQYLDKFSSLLDYLCFDSYRFDFIIEQFAHNKSFFKVIINVLMDYQKVRHLNTSIRGAFQKKVAPSTCLVNFSRLLFNLIINPNNLFKTQFIEDQGVYILKKILKTSFAEGDFEVYFYSLGVIPAIVQTYGNQKQEFIETGYCSMLSEQLGEFYDKGEILHIASPILIAIRALCNKSEQFIQDFTSNKKNLEVVLQTALSSYATHHSLRNIHVSAVALMCQCGYDKFFESILLDMIGKLQKEMDQAGAEKPGEQVQLKERIYRLQEQNSTFKKYSTASNFHQAAINTLKNNTFDDELLEKALQDLVKVWHKVPLTKTLFITLYGNLDLLLQCLRNLDENVMLGSVQCVEKLLQKEEGAQDLFIRHKGMQILKTCSQDYNIDIKKCSLKVLKTLALARDDAKSEILENGVIDQCLTYIQQYPQDEVDTEVLGLALDIISHCLPKNPKIRKSVLDKGELQWVAMKLKLFIENLLKQPEQEKVDETLVVIDKLTVAIINLIYGLPTIQDQLKDLQIFPVIFAYLHKYIESPGGSNSAFNQGTVISLLNLLVNSVDTNKGNQDYFMAFKPINVYDLLVRLLHLEPLRLSGFAALLISHLSWNHSEAQSLFSSREVLKRLIALSDFNELINQGDPEDTVEATQEISFYALLALINLSSQSNATCQQLIAKLGGLEILLNLLRSPSFDAKKTVCLCLGHLLKGNQGNAQQVVSKGGVMVLVELINDEEEDDELSNKAYQCLEYMGQMSVFDIIRRMKELITERELKWRHNNTIMLDVFMRRERHIYVKSVQDENSRPSLRDFGPQSEDDMCDQASLDALSKCLPVLNGLLYINKENRRAVQANYDMLMTLFDVFKCQLPIELHENALYALLNLLQDCKPEVKDFILNLPFKSPSKAGQGNQRGGIKHLLKYLEDLYELEFEVLKGAQSKRIVIVDYGVRQNPMLEAAHMKEEKTIEEMQSTIFDARYYEYFNDTDQMFFYSEPAKKKELGVPVAGKEFEGLGLRKGQVISHIRELRSLGYQILNSLTLGNSKMSLILVNNLSQSLPQMLMRDAVTHGLLSESSVALDTTHFEALDFLLNLCSAKDLFSQVFAALLKHKVLEDLVIACRDFEFGEPAKQQLIIAKITQVISDNYVEHKLVNDEPLIQI